VVAEPPQARAGDKKKGKQCASLFRVIVDATLTIWFDVDAQLRSNGRLRVLKSGALKLRKLHLSDRKAYVYGDTAVVTGTSIQDGDFQGQPLANKIVFTDTFVRHGDDWKAVASHRTASQ
jgi:Domain of unknown function (DUF4440)